MIKNNVNDKGQANDVSGVYKGREKTRGENPIEHHNTQKWTSTKRSLLSKSPWHVPSKGWMTDRSPKREW
jgi:hypothetical protein